MHFLPLLILINIIHYNKQTFTVRVTPLHSSVNPSRKITEPEDVFKDSDKKTSILSEKLLADTNVSVMTLSGSKCNLEEKALSS